MPSITVDRNPNPEAAAAVARAGNKGAEAQEARRAKVAAMRQQAEREAASGRFVGDEAEEANEQAAAPREQIDCVEVELPRGQLVEFGPPSSVALTTKLMGFFGGRDPSMGEEKVTSIMLCIRSIDGRPVDIRDAITRDKILNEIGDDGFLVLANVHRDCWPPPTRADIKILKRVFR